MTVRFIESKDSKVASTMAVFRQNVDTVLRSTWANQKDKCSSCGKDNSDIRYIRAEFPSSANYSMTYYVCSDEKCQFVDSVIQTCGLEYKYGVFRNSSLTNKTVNVSRTSGEKHLAKVSYLIVQGDEISVALAWYNDMSKNNDSCDFFHLKDMQYHYSTKLLTLQDFLKVNPDITEITIESVFKSVS